MVIRILLLSVGLVLGLGGCASVNTEGRGNLGRQQRVFVEERLNDNLGVARLLATELRAAGYEAAHGPLTMMPEGTQLVVTYDVRETWDFRPYVIELNLAVRPARDYNRPIASARYFRPGVMTKSPEAIVRDLVQRLFPARAS